MKDEVAVIKYDTVMLKALPSKVALTNQKAHLGFYLEGLLSLHGEVSTKRLAVLLSFVETLVGDLSLKDVKEAFMMHVRGKLLTEPRTNYLDTILFSKVIQEYKNQRIVKKPKMIELTQKEKDKIKEEEDKIKVSNELTIYSGVINCFEAYKQTNTIVYGYIWVYDHLDELNIINYSDDVKRKQMPIAKESLINQAKETKKNPDYLKFISSVQKGTKKQAIINKAKNMLLCRFFGGLIAKEKHIKNLL